MRGGRKAVCRLGILGLLLLCCFLAKAAAAGTEKYSEGVSVRKTKGTWSPAEADSIRQEESEQEFPDSCIFWGERGEEVLENEKLDRMEQASVIDVYKRQIIFRRGFWRILQTLWKQSAGKTDCLKIS